MHAILARRNLTLGEYSFVGDRICVLSGFASITELLLRSLLFPMDLARAWRFMRRRRIEAVVFTMHNPWNAPLMLLCRWLDTPFIYVVHDAELHGGENTWPRRLVLHVEIALSRRFVCLTDDVSGHFRRIFGIAPENVVVIRHGAYLATSAPERRPSPGPLRLLFFGRIVAYKGLHLLCEAMHILRASGAEFQVKVVGEGRLPPCLAALRGWSNVDIRNRFVDEAEIEPLFREADVLVVPYTEASQSGVVPLSFGFGVPVVCTPVGGLLEQVRHRDNGIIASRIDGQAIADSLLELHRDPALLERLSEGASRAAATELDWSKAVSPLVEALNSRVNWRLCGARSP